jgi:hypothetical protein
VPRDDPGAWLIREPTAKVFDDSSAVHLDRPGSNTFDKQPFQVRFKPGTVAMVFKVFPPKNLAKKIGVFGSKQS